jgi:NAD(P) transhydrogenase
MKPAFDYDLVCIGSGPAGQRAAVQAAKLGKRVAVLEKQRCVGGVCIETGTIPSKTFREAVRGFSTRVNDHGASRTRPTMDQLLRRVTHVIQREEEVVQDQLARNGIDLVRGRAAFVDPHVLSLEAGSGRKTVSAAHVLVAVGTRPSEPRGVRPDGQTLVLSDNLLELEKLEKLPRTMVVVGGGVIGIESKAASKSVSEGELANNQPLGRRLRSRTGSMS